MILDRDRKMAMRLIRWGLWSAGVGFWRVIEIHRCWGTEWLYCRMMARQTRDDLHHAPCCEANHWHYQRLVFKLCTCGAAAQEAERLAAERAKTPLGKAVLDELERHGG